MKKTVALIMLSAATCMFSQTPKKATPDAQVKTAPVFSKDKLHEYVDAQVDTNASQAALQKTNEWKEYDAKVQVLKKVVEDMAAFCGTDFRITLDPATKLPICGPKTPQQKQQPPR